MNVLFVGVCAVFNGIDAVDVVDVVSVEGLAGVVNEDKLVAEFAFVFWVVSEFT